MWADPKPNNCVSLQEAERSPVEVNTRRVDGFSVVNLLEPDGRVRRVFEPQLVRALDLSLPLRARCAVQAAESLCRD